MSEQNRAPLFEELLKYSHKENTSFDVPGHKQGLYTNRFNEQLGDAIRMDVNSMPELDLLYHPVGIIKEAQQLMADCYNVDHSYFLVNGTTVGILSMIYASVKENEKIIVPRNVHKSVISAIILSGAIPIFVEPELDEKWMINNGVALKDIQKVCEEHGDIKAILIINPTYFGIMSEYDAIINYAKENNIISLVDQAHGAHFNFIDGYNNYSADLMAISTHKTLGSMSQSSVLLHNEGQVSHEEVMKALSMFQSTSASYLLMASLDETRRDIVTNKLDRFNKIVDKVKKTRIELNKINGISVLDEDYLINEYRDKLDPLKITIKVNELGLTGFDVYKILKRDYNIQMELAETYTVLAIISIADNKFTLNNLVEALKDISNKYYKENNCFEIKVAKHHKLKVKYSPKKATLMDKEKVDLINALNRVSANTIMIYPPGIPICLPGEVIDQNVIDLMNFYNKQTIFTISESDDNKIEVVKE